MVLSVAAFQEPLTARLACAAVLMSAGVFLHVTEDHGHEHHHHLLEHEHVHTHDDDHHDHEPEGDGINDSQ